MNPPIPEIVKKTLDSFESGKAYFQTYDPGNCYDTHYTWDEEKAKVGQDCGKNEQCESGLCDCYSSDAGGMSCFCGCKEDSDCGEGEWCNSSSVTYSSCTILPKIGQGCEIAKGCGPGLNCIDNVCKCTSKNGGACPAGQICQPGGTDCYNGKGLLEKDCEAGSETLDCANGRCVSGQLPAATESELRCECWVYPLEVYGKTINIDTCPNNQKCIKVGSQCGWSYCVNENEYVDAVPQNKPVNKSAFLSNPKSTGLCLSSQTNIDPCGPNATCTLDWGPNGCSACMPNN
mgnify:CR=1 FL=1